MQVHIVGRRYECDGVYLCITRGVTEIGPHITQKFRHESLIRAVSLSL